MSKKETPMLYSTPMVVAISHGTKTMTRRAIKDLIIDEQSGYTFYKGKHQLDIHNWKEEILKHCPFGQIGDLIWVRETFHLSSGVNNPYYSYKADWGDHKPGPMWPPFDKWKPSIFMPKEAARTWLEIIDVKVEKLQSISEEDAINEGIKVVYDITHGKCYKDYTKKNVVLSEAYDSFMSLWESINGLESLNANPWVWVVKFKDTQTV